jgi:hypothetical protein
MWPKFEQLFLEELKEVFCEHLSFAYLRMSPLHFAWFVKFDIDDHNEKVVHFQIINGLVDAIQHY